MKSFTIPLIAAFALSGLADTPYGSFDISARNPFGVAFTNPYDAPVLFDFKAIGAWGFQSGSTIDANGAVGDTCDNYGNCPIGWAAVGGLIIWKGSDYYVVGEHSQHWLEPFETIYFLINDAADSYGDNSGVLRIDWFGVSGYPTVAEDESPDLPHAFPGFYHPVPAYPHEDHPHGQGP